MWNSETGLFNLNLQICLRNHHFTYTSALRRFHVGPYMQCNLYVNYSQICASTPSFLGNSDIQLLPWFLQLCVNRYLLTKSEHFKLLTPFPQYPFPYMFHLQKWHNLFNSSDKSRCWRVLLTSKIQALRTTCYEYIENICSTLCSMHPATIVPTCTPSTAYQELPCFHIWSPLVIQKS